MKTTLFCLLTCCCLGLVAADTRETRLGDLPPATDNQAWGTLQIDKGVAGTPMAIAGKAFAHGLGTHARSEIVYDL